MKMIRAVFLDLGDTLVNISDFLRTDAVSANVELFKEKGHHAEEKDMEIAVNRARDFVETVHRGDPIKYKPGVFTGKIAEFLGFEVSEKDLIDISIKFNESVKEHSYLEDGVKETLSWVKGQNYLTAAISNGATAFVNKEIDKFGLRKYFDAIVISEECGAEKSSLKPFEVALSRLKVDPKNTLVVGDRIDEEILAAKKFGMKSVLKKGSIWDGKNYSGEGIQPDYIIGDIIEVKRILEELDANN